MMLNASGKLEFCRYPSSTPRTICVPVTRDGFSCTPSRLGLFRSGSAVSLQAAAPAARAIAMTATARPRGARFRRAPAMVVYDVISEAKVEGEEEAARRRERRDIDVPGERLVAEVAHLGVDATVVAVHEQVAPAERSEERRVGDALGWRRG